ncbi:MAG TPA: alkaline phosphatase PhoX [Gammaproteobacteria bacterium]|nr:alkaline phosphatase PhoX [Gammaproteobacteria bacterium]
MTLAARSHARTNRWMAVIALVLIGIGAARWSAAESPRLTRLATMPLGSEITGLFLGPDGGLFMNVQHPAATNAAPFDRASVGMVAGVDLTDLPEAVPELGLPESDAARQTVRTAVGRYRILAQAGDTLEGAIPAGLGTITGPGGDPVRRSNDPDFNAFVATGEGRGWLFTNWEDRPGGMSRLPLERGPDGGWRVAGKGARMLDFRDERGTWVNCFGTLSPWGTPLSSEELYFPATRRWNDPSHPRHGGLQDLARYLGYDDFAEHWPNPYDYGYIVEITDPAGAAVPRKRRALGRFSHENAVVMPDRRTVYLSDDGTGTVLFRFVADRAGDLSAGTLYAAAVTQDEGDGDPARTGFDIRWVRLGHARGEQVAAWARDYDGAGVADFREDGTSYIADADICRWAEARRGRDLACDGDDKVGDDPFGDDRPAFLESRKAAAALGATAEFRKMEGVNIHPAGARDGSVPFVYLAMTQINKTMADDRGAIRLQANPCGAVYRMRLGPDYGVSRLEPVAVGGVPGEAGCPDESLANPDNLVVLPDGRVVVGEDSGVHDNNMLWLLSPKGA